MNPEDMSGGTGFPGGGERIPEAWVEQQVVFRLDGNQTGGPYRTYGTLHAVSASGLTIRENVTLLYGPINDHGEQQSENRIVPVFYPWHRIEYVRLAEAEEQ